jgi:hypothetical protein
LKYSARRWSRSPADVITRRKRCEARARISAAQRLRWPKSEGWGEEIVPTKWQYRVKFIKVPRTEATAIVSGELNELGEEGWELVNVVEVGTILMAVFKRPVG